MASDQTPPQNRLIVTIAMLAVFTLVTLKFLLGSYYISMTEAQAHADYVDPDQIRDLRMQQNKNLAQSPTPIDVAMKNLATSGRDNASPLLTPQASDDNAPLVGWARLAHDAGITFTHPDAVLADGGMATSADGGMATSTDGGMATSTDGGMTTSTDGGKAVPNLTTDAGHVTTLTTRDAGH